MKFGDKVVFIGQVNETNIIDKLEKGMVGVVTSVSDNYEYPITVNFGDFDEQLCVEELELVEEYNQTTNQYHSWNNVFCVLGKKQKTYDYNNTEPLKARVTTEGYSVSKKELKWVSEEQTKLKLANSKLASIELILLDYYNGEFDTIGDLAGAISFVLNGEEND